ncbi:MAG: MBL fold metallo-hydrolase [Myxococcaceae bacterium]|nr:MBL fold metallo-hydrolase [Myxococcaceae bacterium]MCA3016908.1 MBL fold metallo-hydrolase [Myxococcaceae bacterium]
MPERLTFRRDVSLAVLTRAATARDHHEDLGCSILGPASRAVRDAHRSLSREVRRLGEAKAARQAAALVRRLERTPAYARLGTGRHRAGRLELKPSVLFPDPEKTPPRVLHVRRGATGFDLDVAPPDWPAVADCCAALARGLGTSERRLFLRRPVTATLLTELGGAGWFEPHDGARPVPPGGFAFVGHHTTLLSDGGATVLVDPYFRPMAEVDLPGYAPMHARDLGPVDAVCITHSHGDHFHLGSLLTLPRDTRVFVPPVARESLFSTDCARRLEQLGFTNVEAPSWFGSRKVGALSVHALPFYGEQPTDGPGVYDDLFNVGSTWVVRGPTTSAAFFADAGHDVRGSMREVCDFATRGGPVDVLFCGVRGFRLRPLLFGFTTLDAFLVNVPPGALTTPQRLMAGPAEALEYARRLGARWLVPCADGGAPWYWREGMGPKYPGYPGEPVEGASRLDENPDADPYPERVAAFRHEGDPEVVVLRPGEVLRDGRARAAPGFHWPFAALARR